MAKKTLYGLVIGAGMLIAVGVVARGGLGGMFAEISARAEDRKVPVSAVTVKPVPNAKGDGSMTVGDLKRLLGAFPDTTRVMIKLDDHLMRVPVGVTSVCATPFTSVGYWFKHCDSLSETAAAIEWGD